MLSRRGPGHGPASPDWHAIRPAAQSAPAGRPGPAAASDPGARQDAGRAASDRRGLVWSPEPFRHLPVAGSRLDQLSRRQPHTLAPGPLGRGQVGRGQLAAIWIPHASGIAHDAAAVTSP